MKKEKEIFLAIDIGNTDTVLGFYSDEKLFLVQRISSNKIILTKKIILILKKCLKEHQIVKINKCGISSVVPGLTKNYKSVLIKHFKVNPLIISGEINLGIKNRYKIKSQLGSDRICGAVAGFHKYGSPCIIIDFGTATTIDVVNKRKEFVGGIISPGILSSISGLLSKTSKLREIDFKFPKSLIGRDTISCMQSGLLNGAVFAIEGFIRNMKNEIGSEAKVIATGGFSELISKKCEMIDHLEPNLVLDGIRIIYEKNFKDYNNNSSLRSGYIGRSNL